MTDPRLLIPATPALLDGWCGPILTAHNGHALALAGADGYPGAEVYGLCLETGAYRHASISEARLDLARAEVRDRVCRVLAERVNCGPKPGPAFSFWHDYNCRGRTYRLSRPAGIGSGDAGGAVFIAPGDEWIAFVPAHQVACHIPALGALDPALPNLLPDGSRLRDALALAAVARQVLS